MAKITVVDKDDKVIGSEERDVARKKGLRHRIARVFVVNTEGKILLQKRSIQLKDSPGKWDQSAGGHVDEGEDYMTAAIRETAEELGIRVSGLRELGKFYVERPGSGGVVRRFHTVFACKCDSPIKYDKAEVADVTWLSVSEVNAWLQTSPEDFTKNFASAFSLLKQTL
jgi:isopentenyldiphosphate isomerase